MANKASTLATGQDTGVEDPLDSIPTAILNHPDKSDKTEQILNAMAYDIFSLPRGEVRKNAAWLYLRAVEEIYLSITQSDVDAGVPRHARLTDGVLSDNPPSCHVAQSTSDTHILTHETTSNAVQDGHNDVGTQIGLQGSTEHAFANINLGKLSLSTLNNHEGHEATPEVASPGSGSGSSISSCGCCQNPFDDLDIVGPDIYQPISHSQSTLATVSDGGGQPRDPCIIAILDLLEKSNECINRILVRNGQPSNGPLNGID